MAIQQQCPICYNKLSLKRKKCTCGGDLDKFKRQGKIKYWIHYRIPDGYTTKDGSPKIKYRQRKEVVGYSIEDARAADGKRKCQKKEGRIFDMMPESGLLVKELGEWYLGLPSIKRLKTYRDVVSAVKIFKKHCGDLRVNDLKQTIIEEFQMARQDQGQGPVNH